ncbi:hypothetical protein PF002_g27499 [Phytophthora fragariae]|uniref:Uncharacterized protein n=2 Tax=Phytophthora fragariae TaxID=53985 RepID=A0A6A3W896_9STRA|nr:hypothetical protein PF011_g6580 [Phytophthora fragariae]KAE9171547.1 hypothetical protein PF004_g27527 [Phytophthora fragariae]KAE9180660.1 hypothetical protein PF002_g27499 [Phytophthora fragariae]
MTMLELKTLESSAHASLEAAAVYKSTMSLTSAQSMLEPVVDGAWSDIEPNSPRPQYSLWRTKNADRAVSNRGICYKGSLLRALACFSAIAGYANDRWPYSSEMKEQDQSKRYGSRWVY